MLAGVLAPLRPAASRSASSFRSLSPPPMALLSGLRGGPAAAAAAVLPSPSAAVLPSPSPKFISPSSSASCRAGSYTSAAAPPVLLLLAPCAARPCAARRSTVTTGRCEGCSPAPTPAKLAGAWPPSCCSTAPSCSRAGGGGRGGTPTACCCCCRWRGCLPASCACCCCRQATKCVRPCNQVVEKRWPGGGPTCRAHGWGGTLYAA